jgi:hypothetical protein
MARIDQPFYGIYRALVMDNFDPAGRGRVRVLVPEVDPEVQTGWAPVIGVEASPPTFDIGTEVVVAFDAGDARLPIVLGRFFG